MDTVARPSASSVSPRELRAMLAASGTLETICPKCGAAVKASIGGGAPLGAVLILGSCPRNGAGETHSPSVWVGTERWA